MNSNLNKLGISIIVILIGVACILDISTSLIGFNLGIPESSKLFHLFPSAWGLMMIALALFINWIPMPPEYFYFRVFWLLFVVAFSYTPFIMNSYLILVVAA
jgi:hypothetical protein